MKAIPAPDLLAKVTFHRFDGQHEAGLFATVMIGREDLQVIRPGDGPPGIEIIAPDATH